MAALLERMAAREPDPGGGVAAALAAASAAALAAMAGRFSDPAAFGDDVGRADALRGRACELADRDVEAYATVLETRRLPRDAPGRAERLAAALGTAADVPLAVAEVAREAAGLAARAAREGNPNLRGDALTGVLLADAAARSAARLVELNVRAGGLDADRARHAEALCGELAEVVRGLERAR